MPVTGGSINLPPVSGVSGCHVNDPRLDNMDYSRSKEFKISFELLDPADKTPIDLD